MLRDGYLLFVGEIKSIYTSVLNCASPVILKQLVKPNHTLSGDSSLRQVNTNQGILETKSIKHFLESVCEVLADMQVVREV